MDADEILARAAMNGAVGELGVDLCWELLESTALGRVAIATPSGAEIVPVNFVVDGAHLLFRTAPGRKFTALVENPNVALEIDGVDGQRSAAFSVIVKGRAEVLDLAADIEAAEALGLRPWTATAKLRWVRIRAHEVTGRIFHLGAEPPTFV
jgi:nitroimidazol reductase NimA-like FMN-containing flavoprotein (pyridoxamine 5'-phosphate oxidase superfamily)